MLVLGLHSKDRKYTRDKASISYHKVNRGCPSLTENRTATDCVQISLGPSIQYIPLRVYHTGDSTLCNTSSCSGSSWSYSGNDSICGNGGDVVLIVVVHVVVVLLVVVVVVSAAVAVAIIVFIDTIKIKQ